MTYERNNSAPSAGTPVKTAGRTVYLQPKYDDDHMCLAQLSYRSAADRSGDPIFELIDIKVHRDNIDGSELCAPRSYDRYLSRRETARRLIRGWL
ncbi:hypothetical protein [Fodinicola feengrottensis]|uniref:hypothetical protein n=1 Tax=Fodinicola feengrottensis TaxID=435914 RepID=UPI0013D13C8E|nr:hypothetical protein [Fodinicola feengrottensis]